MKAYAKIAVLVLLQVTCVHSIASRKLIKGSENCTNCAANLYGDVQTCAEYYMLNSSMISSLAITHD